MAQEFTIKSQQIEDKINQLLPSQGGFQAGVDFSASTMVIPIVDLTETAEGSNLRQDLQTSFSLNSITAFNVANATTTIINTTGYFRIYGVCNFASPNAIVSSNISITDGTTTKLIFGFGNQFGFSTAALSQPIYDFIVKTEAGDSITVNSSNANVTMVGNSRQIADLQGNLVNP